MTCKSATYNMSPVTRKPVFRVFDQVRLKLACSAIGTSLRVEILHIKTTDIILSKQWTTKALIRLREWAGSSVPLLFAYAINRFSHDVSHILNSHIRTNIRILVKRSGHFYFLVKLTTYLYMFLLQMTCLRMASSVFTKLKRGPQAFVSYLA